MDTSPNTSCQTDERGGLTSASTVELVLNCPGCSRIIPLAPKEKENEFMRSGKRIHDYLSGGTSELIGEEKIVAQSCLRLEREYAGPIWEGAQGLKRTIEEKRFWLHDRNGKPLMSCKPDRIIYCPPVLVIEDFKSGRIPVTPAPLNWQLKSEAVTLNKYFKFEVCRVALLQPWVSPQISEAVIHARELPALEMILKQGLKEAEKADAPLIAGDHCKYCPGRSVCPEANKNQLAPIAWNKAPVNGAQLSKRLGTLPAVESTIEATRGLARRLLETVPGAIPGWELIPGNEIEHIDDLPAAYEKLKDLISYEEFLSVCKISITGLRMLYANRMKIAPEQAEINLPSMLGDVLKRRKNEPSLQQKRKR